MSITNQEILLTLQQANNKIAELEKERDIRDLEQQAKGVEDAIKETVSDLYRLPLRDVGDLYHYATVLRDQAKTLKEQGDE